RAGEHRRLTVAGTHAAGTRGIAALRCGIHRVRASAEPPGVPRSRRVPRAVRVLRRRKRVLPAAPGSRVSSRLLAWFTGCARTRRCRQDAATLSALRDAKRLSSCLVQRVGLARRVAGPGTDDAVYLYELTVGTRVSVCVA